MPIAPIPPLPSLPSLPSSSPLGGSGAAGGTPAASDVFSNLVTSAVDALQQTQSSASAAEAQAAAGQGNLADTMIAAAKASLETQVTTDLLDKAISSYNSIMSMTF